MSELAAYDIYDELRRDGEGLSGTLRLGPSLRSKVLDLVVGGLGQAGEHVTQVGEGVEAAPAAAFDDGVEDGPALAGLFGADEEPVLLAEGGGADGVFDEV